MSAEGGFFILLMREVGRLGLRMAQLTFIEHMGMSWPPPPMSPWLWSMAAWCEWSIILVVSCFLLLRCLRVSGMMRLVVMFRCDV